MKPVQKDTGTGQKQFPADDEAVELYKEFLRRKQKNYDEKIRPWNKSSK